jgi:hypothetical protein
MATLHRRGDKAPCSVFQLSDLKGEAKRVSDGLNCGWSRSSGGVVACMHVSFFDRLDSLDCMYRPLHGNGASACAAKDGHGTKRIAAGRRIQF